jgi:hypothetical protein
MITYKVFADFSAKAGEYIVIINDICIGVVEDAPTVKFSVHEAAVYNAIKSAGRPINAAAIAKILQIENDYGARAAVSIYIKNLLKADLIRRAPGAAKLGPYEVNTK